MHDGPLVLCYDGSDPARHAVQVAGHVLAPAAAVVVRSCWQPTGEGTLVRSAAQPILVPRLRDFVSELNKADEERAEAVAAEGMQVARAAGIDAVARVVPERDGASETLAQLRRGRASPADRRRIARTLAVVLVGAGQRLAWPAAPLHLPGADRPAAQAGKDLLAVGRVSAELLAVVAQSTKPLGRRSAVP